MKSISVYPPYRAILAVQSSSVCRTASGSGAITMNAFSLNESLQCVEELEGETKFEV
jgi:hypothetical protein